MMAIMLNVMDFVLNMMDFVLKNDGFSGMTCV